MKNFDEHIIALINLLEYDIWAVIPDKHIDCVCKNFDTKQGNPRCPYCLGTGQRIKIKKIKGVRQPESGSARDMTINYTKGIYFFKNHYDLCEGDYLIWDNRVEQITCVEEFCSDAQKPVYYRVEALPKKSDIEVFMRNFCRAIGKVYQKRRRGGA